VGYMARVGDKGNVYKFKMRNSECDRLHIWTEVYDNGIMLKQRTKG